MVALPHSKVKAGRVLIGNMPCPAMLPETSLLPLHRLLFLTSSLYLTLAIYLHLYMPEPEEAPIPSDLNGSTDHYSQGSSTCNGTWTDEEITRLLTYIEHNVDFTTRRAHMLNQVDLDGAANAVQTRDSTQIKSEWSQVSFTYYFIQFLTNCILEARFCISHYSEMGFNVWFSRVA